MFCRGKIATFLGMLGLTCVLIAGFSHVHDDGIDGPLVKFLSFLFSFQEQPHNTEIVIKSVGFFDFFEDDMRRYLKVAAILFVFSSGILAILASKHEESSLWYSVAVFISSVAVSELSYIGAGVYVITCLLFIMWIRHWRLSKS